LTWLRLSLPGNWPNRAESNQIKCQSSQCVYKDGGPRAIGYCCCSTTTTTKKTMNHDDDDDELLASNQPIPSQVHNPLLPSLDWRTDGRHCFQNDADWRKRSRRWDDRLTDWLHATDMNGIEWERKETKDSAGKWISIAPAAAVRRRRRRWWG